MDLRARTSYIMAEKPHVLFFSSCCLEFRLIPLPMWPEHQAHLYLYQLQDLVIKKERKDHELHTIGIASKCDAYQHQTLQTYQEHDTRQLLLNFGWHLQLHIWSLHSQGEYMEHIV